MVLHKIAATSTYDGTLAEEDGSDDAASGSESSASSEGEEETWDDWVSDPQPSQQCFSLFEQTLFPSAADALMHDKTKYGFDLDAVCQALSLDFHGRARLVNYIRKEKPAPAVLNSLSGKEELFSQDSYLLPVIEDDPLLQIASDDWSDDEDVETGPSSSSKPVNSERRIRALENKLAQAKQDLADYRKLVEARFDLSRLAEQLNEPSGSSSQTEPKARDDDSHYFGSYAENDIHAVMIQDKVRTSTYASFILSHPTLFQDAIVLDVGCGTGILSLFAARAGAKHVFAVDASDIADKAKEIVRVNGLQDVITVIRGKVEDIQLPDGIQHVDVIISEWMGYALLYESMLDSVLAARDRFLRPEGGVMVPSQCQMKLGLCKASEIHKERIKFWSDVYGFDMSEMAQDVYEDAIADIVGPETMVSESVVIKDVHVQKVATRQLDFSSPFTLTANCSRRTTVHAFLLYFDTFFTTTGDLIPPETEVQLVKGGEPSVAEVWRIRGDGKPRRSYSQDMATKGKGRITSFSTGPHSEPTHWKQTIFLLREPLVVEDGTVVSGQFHCRKSSGNSRELDVEIHYSAQHVNDENVGDIVIQTFKVR